MFGLRPTFLCCPCVDASITTSTKFGVAGIGDARPALERELGIRTHGDMLSHYPLSLHIVRASTAFPEITMPPVSLMCQFQRTHNGRRHLCRRRPQTPVHGLRHTRTPRDRPNGCGSRASNGSKNGSKSGANTSFRRPSSFYRDIIVDRPTRAETMEQPSHALKPAYGHLPLDREAGACWAQGHRTCPVICNAWALASSAARPAARSRLHPLTG